jgi:hypothetical protein
LLDAGRLSKRDPHRAYCDAPASSTALPATPANFSVALEQTACFGTCPVFSLAIDQDGHVNFYGDSFVSRFGVHEKQIAAADARAIYDTLYQAGYATSSRCYIEAADGCSNEYTDAPFSNWSVTADGTTKAVDRYHGCVHPSPEVARIDQAERVVIDRAGVSAWVDSARRNTFVPVPADLKTTGSYRLSRAGQSLGTLTIPSGSAFGARTDGGVSMGQYSWQLFDCANVSLASGAMFSASGLFVLLSGPSQALSPFAFVKHLPFPVPSLGDVGSIVIDIPAMGTLQTARAQRGDEEFALELTADQEGC